jgi:hypothetical protein
LKNFLRDFESTRHGNSAGYDGKVHNRQICSIGYPTYLYDNYWVQPKPRTLGKLTRFLGCTDETDMRKAENMVENILVWERLVYYFPAL